MNTEDNANISAGRTEECYKAAKAVGDYLDSLNLPVEANNRLTELMTANLLIAERDAFRLGIGVAGYAGYLAAKENRLYAKEKDIKAALKKFGALAKGGSANVEGIQP